MIVFYFVKLHFKITFRFSPSCGSMRRALDSRLIGIKPQFVLLKIQQPRFGIVSREYGRWIELLSMINIWDCHLLLVDQINMFSMELRIKYGRNYKGGKRKFCHSRGRRS